MRTHPDQESHLREHVKQCGREAVDQRQIYRRLSALIPDRLRELTAVLRGERLQGLRSWQVLNHVLVDPRYVAYLDELDQVNGQALRNAVMFETSMMLQSISLAQRRASLSMLWRTLGSR